ncbi:unnamed protein product [Linum trigynum]|uniref:Uncharacterized protein n=1 Tax=Linum trigynum TaxID=586398 RepID=A0AAV2ECG6_9ROSI
MEECAQWQLEQDTTNLVDCSVKLSRLFHLELNNSKEEAYSFVADTTHDAKSRKKKELRSKVEMEMHRLGHQLSHLNEPRIGRTPSQLNDFDTRSRRASNRGRRVVNRHANNSTV